MEWKIDNKENETDLIDWDFIILDSEHQKKLNQWKHIYYLKILGMSNCNGPLIILLLRKKRG